MKAGGVSTHIAFVWGENGLMNFFFKFKCVLGFLKR